MMLLLKLYGKSQEMCSFILINTMIKTQIEVSASIPGPEGVTTHMFASQSCCWVSCSPLSCHRCICQGTCSNCIPTPNACRGENSCVWVGTKPENRVSSHPRLMRRLQSGWNISWIWAAMTLKLTWKNTLSRLFRPWNVLKVSCKHWMFRPLTFPHRSSAGYGIGVIQFGQQVPLWTQLRVYRSWTIFSLQRTTKMLPYPWTDCLDCEKL